VSTVQRLEIKAHRYDRDRMQRFAAWEGKLAPWLSGEIDEEHCYASFEEFRPEEPVGDWFYWYDEVDYGISGRCLARFRTPPFFDQQHQVELGAGDLFYIRKGTVASFEVLGEKPFVHIIVQMPRPQYVADEDQPSFTN
jgi:hypothetical protein